MGVDFERNLFVVKFCSTGMLNVNKTKNFSEGIAKKKTNKNKSDNTYKKRVYHLSSLFDQLFVMYTADILAKRGNAVSIPTEFYSIDGVQ